MSAAPYIMLGLLALCGLVLLWRRVWPWLFGAWYCTGWFGEMAFWTRARAERYKRGSSDPYAKGLRGPIVFRSGRLLRRDRHRAEAP